MWLSTASVKIRSRPTRASRTCGGTLPLRKPGTLTASARSDVACSTACWRSACGTSTVSRTLLSGSSSTWVAITRPIQAKGPRPADGETESGKGPAESRALPMMLSPRRLAAVRVVGEVGPGAAQRRRARAHEGQAPVPAVVPEVLERDVCVPLREHFLLGVVLAVVVVAVGLARLVPIERVPVADDRVAGLEHRRAPVLRRGRRQPRGDQVVDERVVQVLRDLVAEGVDVRKPTRRRRSRAGAGVVGQDTRVRPGRRPGGVDQR